MPRVAGILALATLWLLMADDAQARCAAGDGDWIAEACYDRPLREGLYGHDILGDTPEWTALVIRLTADGARRLGRDNRVITLALRERHIFEDIAPRIVQMDGDGPPEIIVIDTEFDLGASIQVVNLGTSRLTDTGYFGQRNRWFAPIGAADLDGDGLTELAFVDRPHLARNLTIFRYMPDGTLAFVTDRTGFTNHRIGEDFISGGIRDCGSGPEMIVADAAWQNVLAVTFAGGRLASRVVSRHDGPADFARAMACN